MKTTTTKFILFAGLALAMGSTITSCKKGLPIKSNDKVFKVELFKQGLKQQLSAARGYQFIINKDGRWADSAVAGIGGFNRSNVTFPASVNSEVNIASVTKHFTAVAVLKLLRVRKLNIESKIGQWLPASWPKNSTVANLKFKELLTHTSGIRASGTSWGTLKNVVATVPPGTKDPSYANANFALFRAMIPKLVNSSLFNSKEAELSDVEFDIWMGEEYVKQMNLLVFNPAGVASVCMPTPGRTTNMMLNEAPAALEGESLGDWTQTSGAGGFYLTTVQMARMIAYLVHSDAVIDIDIRDIMDSERIGYNRVFAVSDGIALGHGGLLYAGGGKKTPGLRTLIMKFPNNVELALAINSTDEGAKRDINTIVQTAYNNAWVND